MLQSSQGSDSPQPPSFCSWLWGVLAHSLDKRLKITQVSSVYQETESVRNTADLELAARVPARLDRGVVLGQRLLV